MKVQKLFLIVLFLPVFYTNGQNNIEITSDFPGGNIVVNKISEDSVWLKPDLSLTEGEWFYWYFKITGISGKTIMFKFEQNNVFAKYGPAYSLNNDNTWKWYGENRITNNCFSFSFLEHDTIAFFSMAFPYTEKNLNEFLDNLNNKEILKIDTLCFSPENRVIEKIFIPSINENPTYKVLITARHHACEMMASYVLEGIIQCLLNDKNLQSVRENTEFLIIPFMDKDGVENGEQGKNRIPRDHNRDYDENPVHNSTAALKQFVSEWSQGKLKIALDIHCPWIFGKNNEDIYIVGSSDKKIEKNQVLFSKLLEKNSSGEIKSYHKHFLPYGESWNTGTNYSQGISFSKWAGGIAGISFSGTIEYPYSNISGMMVSKDNSRVFGETIAHSFRDYFNVIEHK
jgi:hypothetical protein